MSSQTEHFFAIKRDGFTEIHTGNGMGLNDNFPYTFTLYVSEPGERLADNTQSLTGHVFGGFTTPHFSGSLGFSPGSSSSTSSDNISFNDHMQYINASSITFASSNGQFINMVEQLVLKYNDFEFGHASVPEYNIFTNNCIDWIKDIVKESGGNLDFLDNTPGEIKKNLKKVGNQFQTPIVLDLDGDGIATLPVEAGIKFDHDGDGFREQTGWVGAEDGILVLDLNLNGLVDDGRELMGQYYELPKGDKAMNGVKALQSLDQNADGVLNANDVNWQMLQLWVDSNSNGISEVAELKSMDAIGLASLSLSFSRDIKVDMHGNVHVYHALAAWQDGRSTIMSDVFLDPGLKAAVNADMPIIQLTGITQGESC